MLRYEYYAYYIIFPRLSALRSGEGVLIQDVPIRRLTGHARKDFSKTLGFGLE